MPENIAAEGAMREIARLTRECDELRAKVAEFERQRDDLRVVQRMSEQQLVQIARHMGKDASHESGNSIGEVAVAHMRELEAALATPEVYAGVVSGVLERERDAAVREAERLRRQVGGMEIAVQSAVADRDSHYADAAARIAGLEAEVGWLRQHLEAARAAACRVEKLERLIGMQPNETLESAEERMRLQGDCFLRLEQENERLENLLRRCRPHVEQYINLVAEIDAAAQP